MNLKRTIWLRVLGAAMILALAAACAGPATPTEVMDDMEHGDATPAEHDQDMEHEDEHDQGEDHSAERIPNDGAVIRIVSPADGETISGNQIEVKIETENFALGEDGRHWHVYLDGKEAAMVAGGDAGYVLHGVTPGEHEIEVTLANGEHIELEEGASIHVTVSE